MKNIVNNYSSIEQLTNQYLNKQKSTDRNINLSDDQSMRLQKGIVAADSKGVNDSLVLVDDIAFIVNVPSKTVVTAMDQAETNSNVFTNIDGAVIM